MSAPEPKRTSRPSGVERRSRILIAAAPLFEKNGLEGTLVKDIAAAAGVSEALLYKHFPTKEALYGAIRSQYADLVQDPEFLAIEAMEPSSEKLALMIVTMIRRHLTDGLTPGFGSTTERTRVMLNSLADAGQYARTSLLEWEKEALSRVEPCLEAAEAAGDCAGGASHRVVALLTDHAIFILAAMRVSKNDDIYRLPPENLIHEAALFCLRGMGLTPAAIERVLGPAIQFDKEHWQAWSGSKIAKPRRSK